MRTWQALGLRRNPFATPDDSETLSLYIQRPSVPTPEELLRQSARAVVQLCGPNGAGKTTVLETLCQHARRMHLRAVYLTSRWPPPPLPHFPWDLLAVEEPDLFLGRHASVVVAAVARMRSLIRRVVLSCHRPLRLSVPTVVVPVRPWSADELRLLYWRRILEAGGSAATLSISSATVERLAVLTKGNARLALWTLYEAFQGPLPRSQDELEARLVDMASHRHVQ